jgi:Beta-lactamase
VPQCAANGRWSGVTFDHLIDMASGLYDSAVPFADESAADTRDRFFLATTHHEKIEYACSASERRDEPGRRSVYRTVDTYILGTALNARLRRTRGSQADVFDDVLVNDLWRLLGLSPVTSVSRRTRDTTAQPFTGFGLVLQPDDVAKLGQFFSPLNDAADAVLDRGLRRGALQLEPADRGLPAGTDDSMRYNNGFWALPVADLPGCTQEQFIPYWSGFGGVSIVLLPNGVTYYYFSDNDEYSFRRAIDEAARIRRYCLPDAKRSRAARAGSP